MIGVQDERDIEGVGRFLRLHFAVDEVEKMFRLAQVVAHRRERFAVAGAMEIGGDDPDLGRDAAGAALVDLAGRFLIHLRIVKPEHGDGGAHHVHRVGRFRRGLDEIDHAAGQFALGPQ